MTVNHESEDTVTTKTQPEPPAREPAELVVTPASEWPTNEPELVTLPSGAVALLHRPQFFFLRRTGQVPAKVRALVDKRNGGGELTDDEALMIIDYSVSAAFDDPPASLKKKKDTLHVPSMTETDKVAVLRFIDGGL